MERIAATSIDDPSGTVELTVPPGFSLWTLMIVPTNSAGTPDDPTYELKYWADEQFRSTNPMKTGTAVLNQVSVETWDDAVNRIQVVLTEGSTPHDGPTEIRLHGSR